MNLELIEQTLNAVVSTNSAAWGTNFIFGNSQAKTQMATQSPFVEVNVDMIENKQITLGEIGGRDYRRKGAMTFSLYSPVNSGTRENKRVAQEILDTFEGTLITGIVFEDSTHRPIGTIDRWHVESLRLNFYVNITGR